MQLKEKKDNYENETKKKKEAFKTGRIVGKVRCCYMQNIVSTNLCFNVVRVSRYVSVFPRKETVVGVLDYELHLNPLVIL